MADRYSDQPTFSELSRKDAGSILQNDTFWSGVDTARTPAKTSSAGTGVTNTYSSSSGGSGGSVRSGSSGAVANAMLNQAHALLTAAQNGNPNGLAQAMTNLSNLIDSAVPSDEASINSNIKDLNRKAMKASQDKYIALLMMQLGYEGASILYDKATESYNTLTSTRNRLVENPKAYIAHSKIEYWKGLAEYINAIGYAFGMDKQSIGTLISGIGNIVTAEFQAQSEANRNALGWASHNENIRQNEQTNAYNDRNQKLNEFNSYAPLVNPSAYDRLRAAIFAGNQEAVLSILKDYPAQGQPQ